MEEDPTAPVVDEETAVVKRPKNRYAIVAFAMVMASLLLWALNYFANNVLFGAASYNDSSYQAFAFISSLVGTLQIALLFSGVTLSHVGAGKTFRALAGRRLAIVAMVIGYIALVSYLGLSIWSYVDYANSVTSAAG